MKVDADTGIVDLNDCRRIQADLIVGADGLLGFSKPIPELTFYRHLVQSASQYTLVS